MQNKLQNVYNYLYDLNNYFSVELSVIVLIRDISSINVFDNRINYIGILLSIKISIMINLCTRKKNQKTTNEANDRRIE